MKYLQWNNAIVDYFFKPSMAGKEVYLYINRNIIEEIGRENFPMPECGYFRDFCRALRLNWGFWGILNNWNWVEKLQFMIGQQEQAYRDNVISCPLRYGIRFDYPVYIAHLLSFFLPFTEDALNENWNANNFHPRVDNYFRANSIIGRNENFNSNDAIRYCAQVLWPRLQLWANLRQGRQLGFISNLENPGNNRQYVSVFEYHIVFRKEQQDRFSDILCRNDINPNDVVTRENIGHLLRNNSHFLKIPDNIIRSRVLWPRLVERTYNYYLRWDGTNTFVENNLEHQQTGYSRKSIVPSIQVNAFTGFRYLHSRLYSKDGFPSEVLLNNINFDICQSDPEYSAPIEIDWQCDQPICLTDRINKTRYNWKPKDLILFHFNPTLNEYQETPSVIASGRDTFILVRETFFNENLNLWFENIPDTHKSTIEHHTIPNGYKLLKIKRLCDYPLENVAQLAPSQTGIQILFDKSIYSDGVFYSEALPYVWVDGDADFSSNSTIVALYDDGTHIPLTWDEHGSKFTFSDEHLSMRGMGFKLQYGNIETFRMYRIQTLESKSNEELRSLIPKRDSFGKIVDVINENSNYFIGLEHYFNNETLNAMRQLHNISTQHFMSNKDSESVTNTGQYNPNHPGNVLLGYLSSKVWLTPSDFKAAALSLLSKSTEVIDSVKRIVDFSIFYLQDLGYLDYSDDRLYVNTTTAVLIPSTVGTRAMIVGARDGSMIQGLFRNANEHGFGVEVINGENPLIPQKIIVNFRDAGFEGLTQLENLTKHLGIYFSNMNNLFTQYVLSQRAKLPDWVNDVRFAHDLNVAEDFYGGRMFDINEKKFVEKVEDFNRDLCFIEYKQINGSQSCYRLWLDNQCFVIPQKHYGIYLYIKLYKKKETQRINVIEPRRLRQSLQIELNNLTNIVRIEDRDIYVPANCRLPKYQSIAMCLMSGNLTRYQYNNDDSLIRYTDVQSLFARNTLQLALGQAGL